MNRIWHMVKQLGGDTADLGKWMLLSLLIGVAGAFLGTGFALALEKADHWYGQLPWLRYCLPLLGLARKRE